MTVKCVGCGLHWNVSIYQKIPRSGYICPHCESGCAPVRHYPTSGPARTTGRKQ